MLTYEVLTQKFVLVHCDLTARTDAAKLTRKNVSFSFPFLFLEKEEEDIVAICFCFPVPLIPYIFFPPFNYHLILAGRCY